MIDYVIMVLAVIIVYIFVRKVIDDFRSSTSKECTGCCRGCKLENRCKDLKK